MKIQSSKLENNSFHLRIIVQDLGPVPPWSKENLQQKVSLEIVDYKAFYTAHFRFLIQDLQITHDICLIPLLSCKILFATLFLKGYEDCGSPLPMFQTGSGKSVLVSESSMQKARAVLKEEGDVNGALYYIACISNFILWLFC